MSSENRAVKEIVVVIGPGSIGLAIAMNPTRTGATMPASPDANAREEILAAYRAHLRAMTDGDTDAVVGHARSSTVRNGSLSTVAGVVPVNPMTSRCRWDWS